MFTNRLTGAPRMVSLRALIALGVMAISATAVAKTELMMAHQLEGQHASELQKMISAFNADSKDVEVRLVSRAPNGKPAVLNLATRADLAQVQKGVELWDSRVKGLSASAAGRSRMRTVAPGRNS